MKLSRRFENIRSLWRVLRGSLKQLVSEAARSLADRTGCLLSHVGRVDGGWNVAAADLATMNEVTRRSWNGDTETGEKRKAGQETEAMSADAQIINAKEGRQQIAYKLAPPCDSPKARLLISRCLLQF